MNHSNANKKVIELSDVGFFYPKRKGYFSKEKYWALKKISFTLCKGESLGVIGKNGVGKSTLLKLLGGIIVPDQGQLINHGYTTSLLALQTGFIPYLTGRENSYLNGMYLGIRKKDIVKKIDEIKEFSGLDDFFDQPIGCYSSGMRARLGFSIAFQLDPDVLLIDEVLGVGDDEFRKKSTEMMKEKIRSNKTVVLVSHSAATIKELCDKAVWIDAGNSIIEGETSEVLAAYSKSINKK